MYVIIEHTFRSRINGLLLCLFTGQFLGFLNFIPPYALATDQEISTGVNYGSGSAGIREESGSHLVITICKELTLVFYVFFNHKNPFHVDL